MVQKDHYRPSIDGLRALAVMPVILFHAGFDAFAGGFVGVDIFFAVSGYLITNIILRDISEGHFSLRNFYERRARRILPALLLVCLASIPFAVLWMFPNDLASFAKSLLAVNLFASNIFFWREAGYFSTDTELLPLIHTWTLAVEEQFYVFFPLLLWVFRKLSRLRLFALIGLLTSASLLLSDLLSERLPAANFYLLPSRAWELGAGALVAIAFGERTVGAASARSILSILGLVLIVAAVALLNGDYPYPGRWALLPVLGTVFVIMGADSDNLVGKLLAWRPLVGVGLISYSAYLWHQPLFAFARLRMPTGPASLEYIALIAATFILAYLTWRLVEKPFRNRQAMHLARVSALLVPAAIACTAFGIVSINGLPQRDGGLIASLSRELWKWPEIGPCADQGDLRLCGNTSQPSVILWGDSYAEHLEPGISNELPSGSLVKAIRYACGPIVDLSYIQSRSYTREWARDCAEHNLQVVRYMESKPSLRFAVLSFNLANYTDNTLVFNGHDRQPDVEFIAQRISATLNWLKDHHIQPILVGPAPQNGNDFGRCLAESRLFESPIEACDFDRPYHAKEEAILGLLTAQGHEIFRIEDATCDEKRCRASIGSVLLYRDGGHLTWEGSRLVWTRFSFVKDSSLRLSPITPAQPSDVIPR